MVKDLNITSHTRTSDYKNLTFFTSNNARVNKKFTDRLYTIANEILEGEESSTHGGSLGKYFTEK